MGRGIRRSVRQCIRLFVLRAICSEEALPTELCIGLGLACGVLEQAGDSCESLKRSCVKDLPFSLATEGYSIDWTVSFAGPVLLAYLTWSL